MPPDEKEDSEKEEEIEQQLSEDDEAEFITKTNR